MENNLNSEKYKGYTIDFRKEFNGMVTVSRVMPDILNQVHYLGVGLPTKEETFNWIKDQIDSLTKQPDISNPDGLENFWVKGTNKVIRIRYSPDSGENPREWSNGTMFSLHHKRYNLPEELGIKSSEFGSWKEMKSYITKEFKPKMIRQVSMYDHSGVSLSLGSPTDRWDSGIVGFIVITKDSWKEVMGDTPFSQRKGEEMIKNELETYDAWQKGEVYGWEIINGTNENVEDSMGGFIYSGFKSSSEFNEYLVSEAGYSMKQVKEL